MKINKPAPILIEGESGVNSPFSLVQTCTDTEIYPAMVLRSCEVSVSFAPTEAGKYSGSLLIEDNLEPHFGERVRLTGTAKAKN
jgi:hypothetical protein